MKIIDRFLSKFEEHLGEGMNRNAAFKAILEEVEGMVLPRDTKNELMFSVAHHSVENKELILNLKEEVSVNTSLSLDYSHNEKALAYLSANAYLNKDTIKYVLDEYDKYYKKYRGGSCMQDGCYNIPFYGFNIVTLNNLIEVFGSSVKS